MTVEIKSRWDGNVLYTAENAQDVRAAVREAVAARTSLRSAYLSGAYLSGADLRSADLSGADLSSADLRSADLRSAYLSGAYLRSAYLSGADLSGADLRSADLSGADLSGADLRSADLSGARGVAPEITTDLLMLLDQPGKIRAYKLVDANGNSPINGTKLTYKIGETLTVKNANTDPAQHCAAGINVATLPWCLKEWRSGYRVLIVEFDASDIAAIPHGTDGKFRLHRCEVVGEKKIDPVALGLVKVEKKAAA